jgi:toxin-antitoxin system PIN domain toxin
LILVDANVLIYAHVASFAQHARARQWLDAELSGNRRVGLPWPSLLAFLRIVTNPRVFERPEPMTDAWRQVADWLASQNAWIPIPTERHQSILGGLLGSPGAQGAVVPDAHLAALALEHGLEVCTTDAGFARFPQVRCINPLL